MASSSSSSIQKTESSNDKEMEPFIHFSHEHPLSLIQLQPHYNNENSDNEDGDELDEDENKDKEKDKDEDEDEDEEKDEDENFVEERGLFGTCIMCEEEIYTFHLSYYSCEECDYTLHKFCAELPKTHHNHPLHLDHSLTLSKQFKLGDLRYLNSIRIKENSQVYIADDEWICSVCDISRKKFYNYHCSICEFNMDIICATMYEQKMVHPSHHHQLQRYLPRMMSGCNACGDEHSGTFYHCTTCFSFRIHLDCALLPAKLLIQQSTNGSFSHSHSLTLKYSFHFIELKAKFFPRCIVCDKRFLFDKWHYRCDKCRYYVHVDCATSRKEAFMSSILMPAGVGKTYKNFNDGDLPNLIRCPFPDESINLLKHYFIKKGESVTERKIDGGMFGHQHPLILFDTLGNGSVSLHDPMKRVELLCDGCVRPITDVPFYKCSQHDCAFILHEWCTRLPSDIQNHHDHPQHKLVLLSKVPGKLLGVFKCNICELRCNGFAYGCKEKDCKYYVDIHCGFIPNVITHEAHPNHFLKRLEVSPWERCKACRWSVRRGDFHCSICDFYLHMRCALLLPRTIRHVYDKSHPLILRYYPLNSSEYFCEICETELYPVDWFYHCTPCASSIHTACAPVKVQCDQRSTPRYGWDDTIFNYINVKFGKTVKTADHAHSLTFVQGIKGDGKCNECDEKLKRKMILKCFQCKFRIHYKCVKESANSQP